MRAHSYLYHKWVKCTLIKHFIMYLPNQLSEKKVELLKLIHYTFSPNSSSLWSELRCSYSDNTKHTRKPLCVFRTLGEKLLLFSLELNVLHCLPSYHLKNKEATWVSVHTNMQLPFLPSSQKYSPHWECSTYTRSLSPSFHINTTYACTYSYVPHTLPFKYHPGHWHVVGSLDLWKSCLS